MLNWMNIFTSPVTVIDKGTIRRGKIYLAEYGLVGQKCIGCSCQCFRKIIPESYSGQIKERHRNAVGRDAGQTAEHEHEYDRCKYRLNEKPYGPEDRLLVKGHNIAPDVHLQQIAVLP